MKTKLIVSIILAFLSVTGFAQSSKKTTFDAAVIPGKVSGEFKLFVSNPAGKKISLEIIHPQNGVMSESSFRDKEFACRYDFRNADEGVYQITLVSGRERIVKKIEINAITRRDIVLVSN